MHSQSMKDNAPVRNAGRLLMALAGLAMLAAAGCAPPLDAEPRLDPKQVADLRSKLLSAKSADEGAAATTAAATGTGWATLKGRFKLDGSPPPARKLDVNKDIEVCTIGGGGLLDDSLTVSSDGGIANVVVYAVRVGRVNDAAAPDALKGKQVLFDQKHCMFLSHVVGVQVGETLEIKNSDPVGHNTNITATKGSSFNQTVSSGESLQYKVTAEESFPAPVSCNIHPWMKAYLLPRKNLYFAVTGADGTFEIKDLPAGEEVELQIWHERAAGPQGGLVLSDPNLKCSPKGRCKVTLKADEVKDWQVSVPVAAFR